MKEKIYIKKILVFMIFIIFIGCKSPTEPHILDTTLVPTHISLYGASDGSIDLTVSGGTQPYSYQWSNGAITEDINELSPGLYLVEVIDSEGLSLKDSTIIEDSIHGTVTDYDSNIYKTINIGDQWWMAENLKVTHDLEGNTIQSYVYDDGYNVNVDIYGRLYTWVVAMDSSSNAGARGIAPEGWHIPNNQDWQKLIEYLGGFEIAGGKMKESGTEYWDSENVGATNSSGFSARAAGEREGSRYQFMGSTAIFWASDQAGTHAYYYYLENDHTKITKRTWKKDLAYSVRCVMDSN